MLTNNSNRASTRNFISELLVILQYMLQGAEAARVELARLYWDKIELCGARTQNSVGLLFYCRTSAAFHKLDRRFETGTLRTLVNTTFNALLIKDSVEVSVYDLTRNDDVYQQALLHFGRTGEFNNNFLII